MCNKERKLKEIFVKIIKKQYPEVWDFLGKYFEQWMERKDWLEHEIILKVFCRYFQKNKNKLDCLNDQIVTAKTVLTNVEDFKKKSEGLHNQKYSQWEDWYAELRAIELLSKKGFNKFKYIKEARPRTPDFEAWKNDKTALVEVKHKHFSDEDKIFDEFDRKLCTVSIRNKILRKPFGSNFQKIPCEFKRLLENTDEWQSFIRTLKKDIKTGKKKSIYNQIEIDWREDSDGFSLSDQFCTSPILLQRSPVNKVQHNKQIEDSFEKLYELIKSAVSTAVEQIKDYEKTVACKFDIKYVICFVKFNTTISQSYGDKIEEMLTTRLRNEFKSIYPIII